jgi:hypothetical protein
MTSEGYRSIFPNAKDYANRRQQGDNMNQLWDIFFSRRCVTISEIRKESVQVFAEFASKVQQGWQIPRRLPFEMLHHTEDTLRYQKSFNDLWELKLSPRDFQARFFAWYPRNAYGIEIFLEKWIDEANSNEDIEAIAIAVSSLWNQYGSIKSFEAMDSTHLGNLIASLIRKCGSSRQRMEYALVFLNSVFELAGRPKIVPIFDAMACRLDKHDLIPSLYIFCRTIPTSTPKEHHDVVLDLLWVVDREFLKIECTRLGYFENPFPRFRSCFHIILYLIFHSDCWKEDISIFIYLAGLAEQVIGPTTYRQLWCCIEKEEVYNQAKGIVMENYPAATIVEEVMAEEVLGYTERVRRAGNESRLRACTSKLYSWLRRHRWV